MGDMIEIYSWTVGTAVKPSLALSQLQY